MKSPVMLSSTLLVVLFLSFGISCHAQLGYGYYNGKCGNQDVESIIRSIVQSRFNADRKIVAGLLRLQFHDCFVNGCDASILLDGPFSEKTAPPNLSVFGYDVIDQIKKALEATCPGVVSCSDIIIAAVRDALVMAGGLPYRVQMGRKDGMVSFAGLANNNLPPPNIPVPLAIQAFQARGLNPFDMVLLLGGHTVGVTHCSVIRDRLYNFNGSGRPDPSLNPLYVQILSNIVCPRFSSVDNIVFLDDPSSVLTVDNSYYKQLLQNKGILPIDQAIAMDWSTAWIVQLLANTNLFPNLFNQAMVKLGAVQVLTGQQGQIRRDCRRTN
ncbi:peroxidase 57-like [Typha angustifolia]|uniref:peroxidase 57-like n=1 Tax=Typha angustifolia TaxID=59011 RepID=UPI003C302B03